jgi:DNA-binding Lrp family transcriptional regulator
MSSRENVLALHAQGLSSRKIAKELGLGKSTVSEHISKARAAGQLGEEIASNPLFLKGKDIPGHKVQKTTISVDAQGNIKNQWVRLHPLHDTMEEWVKTLEKRVEGKHAVIPAPKAKASDLMLEIPIPDLHMGMYSWKDETGEDYDCEIARKLLVNGIKSILAEVPAVGKIVLVSMGDFYHADNRAGITERGGNILDMDSRFARRVDEGIKAMAECIELAASVAQEVEFIALSGNHDTHSATWLSRVIAAYFSKTPRIKVRTSPAPRQYVEFGKVMLAYMHGHEMKQNKFASVIPTEQKEMWGRTTFRYGRVAHWHHRVTDEHPGVVIETLPTIAAPDAYAIEHGYLSQRAFVASLWHKEYGLRAKLERCPAEILANV